MTTHQQHGIPAYFVGRDDLVERGEVFRFEGSLITRNGDVIRADGTTRTLVGWSHSECASYNHGRILVPLNA